MFECRRKWAFRKEASDETLSSLEDANSINKDNSSIVCKNLDKNNNFNKIQSVILEIKNDIKI